MAAAVCVALAVPAAAFGYDRMRGDLSATGMAASGASAAASSPAGTRERQPAERTDTRQASVRESIDDALRSLSAAVPAGDEEAFLAVADGAGVRAELARRFRALRALQVITWHAERAGAPTLAGDRTWSTPVRIRHCVAVPDCDSQAVTVATRWRESSSRLRLVAIEASGADDLGPRPWEVSELRTLAGRRVLVAAVPKHAGRLPAVLAAAEKAAALADRYARWSEAPGRYVVYLAGPDEFNRWYGIRHSPWVAGYAMPLTDVDTEVVLNGDRLDGGDGLQVLAHEFAHVATLAGARASNPDRWWLVEGMAEYVRVAGQPVSAYDGLRDVRQVVQSGRWSGGIAASEPGANVSGADANGLYGVAYLSVRRIAERYGEPKLLEFFAAVAREGQPLDEASESVLGRPWDAVSAELAAYVRLVGGSS